MLLLLGLRHINNTTKRILVPWTYNSSNYAERTHLLFSNFGQTTRTNGEMGKCHQSNRCTRRRYVFESVNLMISKTISTHHLDNTCSIKTALT